MGVVAVGLCCVASAVLGRLVLTKDEARRTVIVRIPALSAALILLAAALIFWTLWALICFIGGSFYGLGHWWWPQLFETLDSDSWPFAAFEPVFTGRWDNSR